MKDTVHLDSLSVVLHFTLIQLALMDPTKPMGVMQQGHTGSHTHTYTHTHSGSMQEDPNMYIPPVDKH